MTPSPGEFHRPPTSEAPMGLNTSNRPSAMRQACQPCDGPGPDWLDAHRAQVGHKGRCNWRAAAGAIGAWRCNSVQLFLAIRKFPFRINLLDGLSVQSIMGAVHRRHGLSC